MNEVKEVEKQGHVFFGFCCDTRRAVLVVNTINLVLEIIGLISAAVPNDGVKLDAQSITTMVFQPFFTIMVIYGSHAFNNPFVIIGLLWEVFILCFWIATASTAIAGHDWSSSPGQKQETIAFVVLTILWELLFVIYADAAFVRDYLNGYMKTETYDIRERKSCCCEKGLSPA